MLNSVNKFKQLELLNIFGSNKYYFFVIVTNYLIYYSTPISFSYSWSFEFLAGMCFLMQIILEIMFLILGLDESPFFTQQYGGR